MSFAHDHYWPQLHAHAQRLSNKTIAQLIAENLGRAQACSLRVGPLYAQHARQSYDSAAWGCLLDLARSAMLSQAFQRLIDGEQVNVTEQRPALHTALRSDLSNAATAKAARVEVLVMHERMRELIAELDATSITDVISVGIGGSDLGPRLVVNALHEFNRRRFRLHFINNVDGGPLADLLPVLNPATTAVILISKSFSTQETLLHAKVLQEWLGTARQDQLYAVTAKPEKAAAFGVAEQRCLPMWDWVGGRYSLWSSVGFPIALALGYDKFSELLEGAAAMDAHASTAMLEANLPVWHALSVIWNRNAKQIPTQAILAYDERLELLPDFLQQLWMESLGKSARVDGSPVPVQTSSVVWGGVGTSTQHSFFQALHQGNHETAADFIGVKQSNHALHDHHRALLANMLAQSEAFARGESNTDRHRDYSGNRPNTVFVLDALTPYSLGMLLAMYEHSVYFQSVCWGINAFDQWGVELGKRLANGILPLLESGNKQANDPVTSAILKEL